MISGRPSPPGGVERVVEELANRIAAKGVDFTIFGKGKVNFVKKTGRIKIIGMSTFKSPYPKLTYSFEVWRRIRKTNEFDIIHGHADNCFFPSVLRGETPFIVTFHGTLRKSFEQIKIPLRVLVRAVSGIWAERAAAQACDFAVACSAAVKNELVTLYKVKPNKIMVIYNGVNVDKFFPQDKKEARKRLGLPLKGKYALWVGAGTARKGFSTATRATQNIPGLRLLVVGINPRNDGSAVYLGRVSESDLVRAYSAADFLLFPTVYEGFPLVPLEAMACGLPVIVSEESNYGEIITDGLHGYVVRDGKVSSYKDRIELLLDERNSQERSLHCRKLATEYRWEKQAEQYWKVYLRLMTGQSP